MVSAQIKKVLPFKEGSGFPDVSVAHTAPRRFGDVFLLEQLLDGLGHYGHCIVDVCRLVLSVDELKGDQTWEQQRST